MVSLKSFGLIVIFDSTGVTLSMVKAFDVDSGILAYKRWEVKTEIRRWLVWDKLKDMLGLARCLQFKSSGRIEFRSRNEILYSLFLIKAGFS